MDKKCTILYDLIRIVFALFCNNELLQSKIEKRGYIVSNYFIFIYNNGNNHISLHISL